MKLLGLFNSFRNFYYFNKFLIFRNFRWDEFILPSNLQLTTSIKILIEPIVWIESIDQIELGLHEALVNAVRHGNKCDPTKSLRVRRILTRNWFIWQIQDEGSGIAKEARNFNLPEELDVSSGRGLFLIHHCFDDVRWSSQGNRLQLGYKRK